MSSVDKILLQALASEWETRSEALFKRAREWEDANPYHGDEATRAEAIALKDCANDLIRHLKNFSN